MAKYKIKYLTQLRRQLERGGISQCDVARYLGCPAKHVNMVLHGAVTSTRVVEAVEYLLTHPEANIPRTSHPLAKRLVEAGVNKHDLMRASGKKLNHVRQALDNLRHMPKEMEAAGEELILRARTRGIDDAKRWARGRWEQS